jgi:predicted amidohydrolase YtcJ
MMKNLSSFKVPMNPGTIRQIRKDLKEALKKVPVGGWLTAFGVDPSRATPFMASLDAKELDKVQYPVPIKDQIPMFVLNQSGHIAYVNHRAIDLAGITPNTPNPDGGVYERVGGGQTGELNGVLQEGPAYLAFQKKIKTPTDGVWLEALRQTYKSVAEAGVTTATEMTLGAVTGSISRELALLETMGAELETQIRIRAYVFADVITPQQPLEINPNHGKNDLFKVIGVKFIADGSTQGLTAALKEPYRYQPVTPNPPNRGTLNYTDPDILFNAAKQYLDLGWQLAIHSNGDRTTEQVLGVYSQLSARTGHPSPAELRCRIEHLTVTEEDQLEQIKSLGLTPSMTIGHVYFWGYGFGATKEESHHEPILGSPRAQRIDPAASLLKRGIRFSFNSDSPITPVAPLRYISTAVTRLTQGGKGQKTVELFSEGKDDQRISVDDAIRAVTIDAAYQLFLDDKIGSLEVGKQADLVMLEQNPRAPDMKPEDIMNIKVFSTYLSGVEKYRAPTTPAH